MSQKSIAESCGVSRSTVSRLLRGDDTYTFSLDTMLLLRDNATSEGVDCTALDRLIAERRAQYASKLGGANG